MLLFYTIVLKYLSKAIIYQQYHNVRYEYLLHKFFRKATDIDPYAYKIQRLYYT